MVPDLPRVEQILPYWQQIDSNRWYTNFGPLVKELEERLALAFSCEPARVRIVTMANGTSALQTALKGLKIRRGGVVLVPALTFVATATAIIRAGLFPLVVDVDFHSWLLTVEIARNCLKRAVFDAVLPVATFGCPQDVAAWDLFTAETGIPVVIDAAGAWGNQQVGLTTKVVFSLHATKSLGGGEGGVIASRHHGYSESVRSLSNFGIDPNSGWLVFESGENGKMSEYHAAVVLAALDGWHPVAEARRSLHQRYLCALTQRLSVLGFQDKPSDGVYSFLPVLMPEGVSALSAQRHLMSLGIESRRWYCPPLHGHPAFQAYACETLPIVDKLSERLLGLPFHLGLADEDIDQVVSSLESILNGVGTV